MSPLDLFIKNRCLPLTGRRTPLSRFVEAYSKVLYPHEAENLTTDSIAILLRERGYPVGKVSGEICIGNLIVRPKQSYIQTGAVLRRV